jgi:hypothetical protein
MKSWCDSAPREGSHPGKGLSTELSTHPSEITSLIEPGMLYTPQIKDTGGRSPVPGICAVASTEAGDGLGVSPKKDLPPGTHSTGQIATRLIMRSRSARRALCRRMGDGLAMRGLRLRAHEPGDQRDTGRSPILWESRTESRCYLTAIGATVEPVPPFNFSGCMMKANVYT